VISKGHWAGLIIVNYKIEHIRLSRNSNLKHGDRFQFSDSCSGSPWTQSLNSNIRIFLSMNQKPEITLWSGYRAKDCFSWWL